MFRYAHAPLLSTVAGVGRSGRQGLRPGCSACRGLLRCRHRCASCRSEELLRSRPDSSPETSSAEAPGAVSFRTSTSPPTSSWTTESGAKPRSIYAQSYLNVAVSGLSAAYLMGVDLLPLVPEPPVTITAPRTDPLGLGSDGRIVRAVRDHLTVLRSDSIRQMSPMIVCRPRTACGPPSTSLASGVPGGCDGDRCDGQPSSDHDRRPAVLCTRCAAMPRFEECRAGARCRGSRRGVADADESAADDRGGRPAAAGIAGGGTFDQRRIHRTGGFGISSGTHRDRVRGRPSPGPTDVPAGHPAIQRDA